MNQERNDQKDSAIPRVDYDRIAPMYDRRYEESPMHNLAATLQSLARDLSAERLLEVGCGTARYLDVWPQGTIQRCGLDLSWGMLSQTRGRGARLALVQGRASQMPFPIATFDLVFCVNAIHHFDEPGAFIGQAYQILRPGGALMVVGSNPHDGHGAWYVYEYFQSTLQTDLRRFPSWGDIMDRMVVSGFDAVEWHWVQRILDSKTGQDVLDDPFLVKSASSQLALLSDQGYAAGMRRIQAAISGAAAAGETIVFPVDIHIGAIVGRRRS